MRKFISTQNYARTLVVIGSVAFAHLLILLLMYLLLKPFVLPKLDKSEHDVVISVYAISYFILPALFYFLAIHKKKYHLKLFLFFERQRVEKIKRMEEQLAILKDRKKELTEQFREQYAPIAVTSTNKPFGFLIKLSASLDSIYEGKTTPMLPEVTVNDTPVGVEVYDKTHLLCYVKKAVKSEEKALLFRLGKGNILEAKNPLYYDASCKEEIVWQCEGHANERNIFIPIGYFPQIVNGVLIPFTLKINNKVVGMYTGVLWDGRVTVSLNKDFHRSDCENKEVSLTLQYGNQAKIILPRPTVFFRNNQPVFSKN